MMDLLTWLVIFFHFFWKLMNFLNLFPQLYANRQKWRWQKMNKRKKKKEKNINRIRWFGIIMLTGNKAFFLHQLPLLPKDKSSWNLEFWQKVCHEILSPGENLYYCHCDLQHFKLKQCFNNFTFRLSAHLLTTLKTTPPPQPSLLYSSVVNQIILSNILVYWRQCKYSNFFESLISLCYQWRSLERNPSWFLRFRLMLSVYNKQREGEAGRRGL